MGALLQSNPWEIVLYSSITVLVIMGSIALILIFISGRNMRKRKASLKDTHIELAPGKRVMTAGGLYGTVQSVGEETISLALQKDCVITVSRFAIQKVLED